MSREGRREIVARHRARELALQGIYQWLLHEAPATDAPSPQSPQIQLQSIEELLASASGPAEEKKRTPPAPDTEFFAILLQGAIREADESRVSLGPLLTRTIKELSPVEHAILLLAAFELRHGIETPYRVIINEAIELAKKYGGTDGHKFVNGVLDRLAAELRSGEVAATRRG